MVEEYNVNVQTLFLRMMLTNAELYVRVMNIMNPDNFDKSLRPVASFFKEHMEKYNLLPDSAQVVAVTNVEIEPVTEFEQGHYDWFLDEFEKFTRRQELERAILKSADLLEKGDYNPVEKLIKDAVQISLTKDMGTDYFADPRGRLMQLKNSNGQISTGWPCMDAKLYGGFNRGELNIFAGGSGSGKSLFMQNLSVNWSQAGLNGAYISLELSEELSAMRIDGMMTDTGSRDIFKSIDDVEMKVKMLAKKSGGLQIKYLPAQSTVNDLRSYCKELEIKNKKKLDFLCVDYLDLLMPVSAKVSPSDLFIKDKYVSEELRNLAKELRVLFVTASQLNRTAVDEIQFDHSHISGGISKINTADNVFGIFTSRHMREKGQYQLQLMKTRSSSGVGQNIELAFDLNTLRITDPDPEGSNSYRPAPQPSGNDIMSRLKPSSTVTSVNEKIHETVDVPEKRVEGSAISARINTLLKNNRR